MATQTVQESSTIEQQPRDSDCIVVMIAIMLSTAVVPSSEILHPQKNHYHLALSPPKSAPSNNMGVHARRLSQEIGLPTNSLFGKSINMMAAMSDGS